MIHFIDAEVFEYDWLFVIINPITKTKKVIVNNRDEFIEYYNQYKNEIFCAYNGKNYDQYIMKAILCDFNPKEVNDWIINKKRFGWEFSSLFRKFPVNMFDVKINQNDPSLKVYEGYLGNSIEESTVSFDIDRKLTDEEIEETIHYCTHDVEQMIEVFLERPEEFDVKMYFIKHFNYPLSYISKTKSQLSATILGGNNKGKYYNDEFDFPIVDCLQVKKYKHIVEWYQNPENHDYTKFQSVMVAGLKHTFAWGGLHSDHDEPYHGKGIYLMIDVGGYYPSQQRVFKFGYRVMNNPENFEFIHDSNMEFKRLGDKKKRQPFKILDNAISGQMKQSTSPLFDPMGNNSICVNGQLMLLDLIEHLEGHCELIQSNTDGILVKIVTSDDFDIVDDIVYEWEQRTGLHMDIDVFVGEIFQKDVNNYLIVDRETGAVKSKGAYVKNLSRLDYNLPILTKAVVDYMVKGTPVEKTILECDDLIEFQMIGRISSKYKYLLHGNKILKERCIRCFASRRPTDKGLFKVHNDKNKPDKLEGTPLKAFIYNKSVIGVKVPDYLDKSWYIDEAKKRLAAYGI